jgi:protein-S-isoprenylcysteine O-methyltransferase Ste14
MGAGPERFARHRILVSRLAVAGLLLLALTTRAPLLTRPAAAAAGYWLGFLLLMACAYGRLWSLLFLSGYKSRRLVDCGPFSVTRNPLYLFSFTGALGAALVANHLWLALALLAGFAAYYPFVILAEERNLARDLGAEYEDYRRRVPRLWPRLSLYQRPESWELRLRGYGQAWRDALWFPPAFLLLSLLRRAHEAGWLPLCRN